MFNVFLNSDINILNTNITSHTSSLLLHFLVDYHVVLSWSLQDLAAGLTLALRLVPRDR